MEGLRKLFLYFQDIERTYFLALGIRYYKGNLLIILEDYSLSYGDREPWKKIALTYGTTHPSRRDKTIIRNLPDAKNDGRAPDTTRELIQSNMSKQSADSKVKKRDPKNKRPWLYLQKQLHHDGLRLYRDSSYQSYPWNGTASCWFDASLEALFFCYLYSSTKFENTMDSMIQLIPEIEQISFHMSSRMQAYKLKETISDLQIELFKLRDQLAVLLNLDLSQQSNPLVYLRIISQLIMILGLVH